MISDNTAFNVGMNKAVTSPKWNIEQSKQLYNIESWSDGYVGISENGNLQVMPDRQPQSAVELAGLVDELQQQHVGLPVLVRFDGILHNRVQQLCQVFISAAQKNNYTGKHTAIYPIKVNQQRRVIEEIMADNDLPVGLEAGSKPELMAVLGLARQEQGVIVCNGYKDSEYIRLALIGRQLGHRVYIVVEKLSEIPLIITAAEELGIRPLLGLRIRLASIAAGKWQNSGGEKSKFGLSATQVLQAIEQLQEVGMLDCLEMLHLHMGSQIANIHDIQRAIRESARFYSELYSLGANIKVVDVGGGLGVDYEGTRSRSFCSMNYQLQEYANTIVRTLQETCQQQHIPHPDIFTESGRAMTAHHAVLITNVIDTETQNIEAVASPDKHAPVLLHDMWQVMQQLDEASAVETYHEISHWQAEAQDMYTHGVLNLSERAQVEQYFVATCYKLCENLNPRSRRHREIIEHLHDKMADKIFCNFSLFRSLPDVWAIDQIFPIVPLQQLDEEPVRRGVIHDITCDSDGMIDHYVDAEGIETSMPIHAIKPDQPYLLGMFMVGAYQEILGDIHNLFGDTHSVHVVMNTDGSHHIDTPIQGTTVDEVLRAVHFNPEELQAIYEVKVEATDLHMDLRKFYLKELKKGLRGYTYLED